MFSQRYRGTQWGQPLDPSESPAPKPRGRRFVGIALLSVLAVAAIFAWTALGAKVPGIPGLAPSPTTNKPNGPLAQKFLKLVAADGRTYHVTYKATVSSSDAVTVVEGDTNVAAKDFAGKVRVTRGTLTRSFDAVLKSGRAYARRPGAAWTLVSDSELGASPNVLSALTVRTSLREAETATRGGTKLTRLHTTSWIGGDPERLMLGEAAQAFVESSSADIYVTAAGVPVEAVVSARLIAEIGRRRVAVEVSATYRFSRVGKPVKVTAPKLR